MQPNEVQKVGPSCLKVTGIVLGILFALFFIVIVLPISARIGRQDDRANCLSDLKQIGTAFQMYEVDWGGALPIVPAARRAPEGKSWPDKLTVYIRKPAILRCPARPKLLTYSFNRRLSGIVKRDIMSPAEVPMVFDSVSDSPANNNLNGDQAWILTDQGLPPAVGALVGCGRGEIDLPKWATPNHEDSSNVLYADGRASNFFLYHRLA